MSGWLLIVTLTFPRSRIIEPLPAIAELGITVMPVVRPCSNCPMFEEGSCTFAMSICEMLLPTSRFRAALPVPVTTTASRASACVRIVKSDVTVAPAVTVTAWSIGRCPMNWTRTRCWPTGTLTTVYRPSMPVRVPSEVPTTETWAAASAWPDSDVTVPVIVPVCATDRALTSTNRANVHCTTDHVMRCGENPGMSVSSSWEYRPGYGSSQTLRVLRGASRSEGGADPEPIQRDGCACSADERCGDIPSLRQFTTTAIVASRSPATASVTVAVTVYVPAAS